MAEQPQSHEAFSPDSRIIFTLNGIREGIDGRNADMGNTADRTQVGRSFAIMALQAGRDDGSIGEHDPLPYYARTAADSSLDFLPKHDSYCLRQTETASEIVTLLSTPGVGDAARVAGFRTAAYLEYSAYARRKRPDVIEGTETWAASLARAKAGDPVLLVTLGDYPTGWGGSLSNKLELEFGPQHPDYGTHQQLLVTGQARQAGSDSRSRDLRVSVALGTDPTGATLFTGADVIRAQVRILLDRPNLDVHSHASLLGALQGTGRPLGDFGITQEECATARALYSAKLEEIRKIESNYTDDRKIAPGTVLAIEGALKAIDSGQQAIQTSYKKDL